MGYMTSKKNRQVGYRKVLRRFWNAARAGNSVGSGVRAGSARHTAIQTVAGFIGQTVNIIKIDDLN
jgi:hypothetical protein